MKRYYCFEVKEENVQKLIFEIQKIFNNRSKGPKGMCWLNTVMPKVSIGKCVISKECKDWFIHIRLDKPTGEYIIKNNKALIKKYEIMW